MWGDPSHGTGRRDKVPPMARAAVAAGADGLLIEVHNDPEHALSMARNPGAGDIHAAHGGTSHHRSRHRAPHGVASFASRPAVVSALSLSGFF